MIVTAPKPAKKIPPFLLIVVLALLAGFPPMATDMYLPAFHVMADRFGVADSAIEITLSVFFLGLALGQGVYGPLADRYGRRRPLLAGVSIYVVATAGCLFAPDLHTFTVLRFFQAIGGSAGMIIGRAIVRDLYAPRAAARTLSLLIMIMTLVPMLAPVLGGFIVSHAGWQVIFLIMLGFGLICGTLFLLFVPETLAPEDRHKSNLFAILRIWVDLLRNPAFGVPVVAGGLAQASMFAFITGSPFVFITLFHVSAQTYGWIFGCVALALILAGQGNRMALHRKSPQTVLGSALIVNVIAGLAAVVMVSFHYLPGILIALWFAIGTLGFIGANSAAIAMAASGAHGGSGSSLIGVFQFGLAFIASSLIAVCQNESAYPLVLAIAGCGLASASLWFASARLFRNTRP